MDPGDDRLRTLPTVQGGSAPRFVRHTGLVAGVQLRGRDGEILAPDAVFANVQGASILIAWEIFQTLALETTLARLEALGVRAVLAPGFEARVFDRCVGIGVLPVPLDPAVIDCLAACMTDPAGATMTIDLDKEIIDVPGKEAIPFIADPRARYKLLNGITDQDQILEHVDRVAEARAADRARRPWLYGTK